VTTIDEHAFSIEVPGEWIAVDAAEPGTFSYRSKTDECSVDVVLLRVKPLFSIADRSRLLDDYAHHRMSFERGRTPGLEQSPAETHVVGDAHEVAWIAAEPGSGLLQAHRALLAGEVLADFAYFAWGSRATEAFDQTAAGVLGSARITVEADNDSR
jgi:hypothetical protein